MNDDVVYVVIRICARESCDANDMFYSMVAASPNKDAAEALAKKLAKESEPVTEYGYHVSYSVEDAPILEKNLDSIYERLLNYELL